MEGTLGSGKVCPYLIVCPRMRVLVRHPPLISTESINREQGYQEDEKLRDVMTHHTSCMARMENPTKRLGKPIRDR